MRSCLAALLSWCVLMATLANAQEPVPYKAFVTGNDVYVRSGPGKNYYPTDKLQTGDEVEVYRHDPGGWYAIKPPEGSFAWVSGRYVELGKNGLATITGDQVAARVGSRFSNIRDAIQVRLHRGELVEVLEVDVQTPDEGTWYKIAPPSGEFRWISGRLVDPDYPRDGIRKTPSGSAAGSITPLASGTFPTSASVAPASQEADSQMRPPSPEAAIAHQWVSHVPQEESRVESTSHEATIAGTSRGTGTYAMREFSDPVDVQPDSRPTRRISPEEFQRAVDDVDLALSIMLVEEVTVWEFDELRQQTESLLARAETALERGRARRVLNQIIQSDDIKRRFDAVNSLEIKTEQHNRQLADIAHARRTDDPSDVDNSRFDGVGRLEQVVPAKLGAPRYALVDEEGDVRSYVTPAPGVNMRYYIGRRIGINGIRGPMAEQDTQHVTAKHVTMLDSPALR